MSRVATYAQFTLIQQAVTRTQERIFDRQAQIASGHEALDFAGVATEAHQLVSIKAASVQAQTFIDQNNQIDGRLQIMDTTLGNLGDLASTLKSRIIQRLNSATGDASAIGQEATQMLSSVAGLLNTQVSGRFLFAGAKTDSPPVTDPVPDPATFGVPDASYYQGDSTELTARVSETQEVRTGMAGNRQGFQDLIGALKATIEGDNTNNTGLIKNALDLVSSAIDQINAYRAEVGTASNAIDRATASHQDFQLHADGIVSDIQNVDVPSAVSALSADQAALQASYITVARITQLSLADFLR
jgi:flagellar hook-associated protein 3 FlgL